MATMIEVTAGNFLAIGKFTPHSIGTGPSTYTLIREEIYYYGEVQHLRHFLELTGSEFIYSGTDLIGGTITSISYSQTAWAGDISVKLGGEEVFSNVAIDAAMFMDAFDSGSWKEMTALLYPSAVAFIGPTHVSKGYIGWSDAFDAGTDNDTLIGGIGDDTLRGYAGDDYINGGSDRDVLIADSGADLVFGEEGADTIWAGEGNDSALAGNGNDLLFGQEGNDVLFGESDHDTLLAGSGDDFAAGGAGNDYVAGETGADYLMGEAGDDTLSGGLDNDVLVGGSGADALFGDDGADALFGGTGNDYYVGGAGNDYFYAFHDGPVAGELDIIDGFEVWTSGTADYLVLPAAYQTATSVFDQGGYTWVATQTTGGPHYIAITGANAAFVTAQTVWI
jgi:Ca2+-binding RTX toxin-like protein